MKLLVDFLEDKISPKDFLNTFYEDKELQAKLELELDVPPYTNCINLCLYIFEANVSNFASIYNLKDAIRKYLEKEGISFSYSNEMEKSYEILLSALPKWLDIEPNYFEDILKNKNLSQKEKKEEIKLKIEKDFRFVKKPPKWLQSPQWKFIKNKPLLFIGELDMVPEKDRAKIYIFYNDYDETYHVVNQAD